MQKITVRFTVNGTSREVQTTSNSLLLDVIRDDVGLTGTKNGCSTGECGACTVLLDGKPVYSCLLFAWQADGHDIVTIEGIAKSGDLHPVQQAFIDVGAVQCGFCTPGIILSAVALLRRIPNPTEAQIRDAISGHLCRCTGYTKIVQAIRVASQEMSNG